MIALIFKELTKFNLTVLIYISIIFRKEICGNFGFTWVWEFPPVNLRYSTTHILIFLFCMKNTDLQLNGLYFEVIQSGIKLAPKI